MNCKAVQPLLSAYLDRELSGNEMLDIRAHLGTCEPCRTEAENLRILKRMLVSLDSPEPSEALEERLMASVLREHRSVVSVGHRRVPAVLLYAGVAACSMVLTFLAISQASGGPAVASPSIEEGAMAREITRDRIFSVGGDAYAGAPVITAASYGGH